MITPGAVSAPACAGGLRANVSEAIAEAKSKANFFITVVSRLTNIARIPYKGGRIKHWSFHDLSDHDNTDMVFERQMNERAGNAARLPVEERWACRAYLVGERVYVGVLVGELTTVRFLTEARRPESVVRVSWTH